MPEPTSATAAAWFTIAATSATVPVISFFGIPLGLRVDVLFAGFLGSLVGIILLNTVPGTIDTWLNMVRTTTRRMSVSVASCITAGYLTPLVLLMANVPDPMLLCGACAVGAGAQQVLNSIINRLAPKPIPVEEPKP